MYFSIKTQGFYVGDFVDEKHMPDDCVEVSRDVETKIRDTVLEGNLITSVKGGKVESKKL